MSNKIGFEDKISKLLQLFSLEGKVAVITGGAGVLGGAMASGLAMAGARVAILNRNLSASREKAAEIESMGAEAIGLSTDVLNRKDLENARRLILDKWGSIDFLLNVAGGNLKGATIGPEENFFDLAIDDFDRVVALNLKGTVLPTFVFGEVIANKGHGVVINISSMSASQPFTRVVGYSAAKAGIDNFTKWLAVEMNSKFGAGIRVNAIAPGVFIGKQNKALLLDETGKLTARGQTIIDHTPMGRFGNPEDLMGTVIWLCSEASSFINGVVIPVDGGFSAFSGV